MGRLEPEPCCDFPGWGTCSALCLQGLGAQRWEHCHEFGGCERGAARQYQGCNGMVAGMYDVLA
eukprot:2794027-Lingulodinium_polyedra.AAC.1